MKMDQQGYASVSGLTMHTVCSCKLPMLRIDRVNVVMIEMFLWGHVSVPGEDSHGTEFQTIGDLFEKFKGKSRLVWMSGIVCCQSLESQKSMQSGYALSYEVPSSGPIRMLSPDPFWTLVTVIKTSSGLFVVLYVTALCVTFRTFFSDPSKHPSSKG